MSILLGIVILSVLLAFGNVLLTLAIGIVGYILIAVTVIILAVKNRIRGA